MQHVLILWFRTTVFNVAYFDESSDKKCIHYKLSPLSTTAQSGLHDFKKIWSTVSEEEVLKFNFMKTFQVALGFIGANLLD